MDNSPKITPSLWFNFNAEEAVEHYRSIFRDVEVLDVSRYGEAHGELAGKALTMRFTIYGQMFLAINAGPQYPFTPAISLMVDCLDQSEVDDLWTKLCDGGAEGRCGWLTDKFGLSWQIVPRALGQLLSVPDPEKSGRVMRAMMSMNKIDVAALQAAHDES